jgi:hypothetical protein
MLIRTLIINVIAAADASMYIEQDKARKKKVHRKVLILRILFRISEKSDVLSN